MERETADFEKIIYLLLKNKFQSNNNNIKKVITNMYLNKYKKNII